MKAAVAFMDASPLHHRFLCLLGKKGTGKTVAAAWVLREAYARNVQPEPSGCEMRRPEPVAFILASAFARLSGYAAEDKAWLRELETCRCLCIDDFGAEHMTSFGVSMLDELLTKRHGARLRTVITSNLSKQQFTERVGERLFDRISTTAVVSVTTGESLRKRNP